MSDTAKIAKERIVWCHEERGFQEWKARFEREWAYRDMRAAELMAGHWYKRGITTAKPVVRAGSSNLIPQAGTRTVCRWRWQRI